MAFIPEDRPRQAVPRWRLFDETLSRGELAVIRKAPHSRFNEESVSALLHDWKQTHTLSVASDLVSVALVLGFDHLAIDAAEFVAEHPAAPAAASSIASLYLGRAMPESEKDFSTIPQQVSVGNLKILAPSDRIHIAQVHQLRGLLAEYPRNPIQWCNLALLYTGLGVADKAMQAVKVALSLAPHNRFVLRSAARFFLHQEDRERAHRILVKSPLLRGDPWILAAEIAIADAMRKSSRLVKYAKKLLGLDRFSSYEISELASAVGTIEFKAGKDKAGKRIIGQSLATPSENAVAQAAWISRNVTALHVPQMQSSPEAVTFRAWREQEWESSLENAEKWLEDQPFSSRPAIHGSFLASTVYEDFEKAMMLAAVGLRSNPQDSTLLNNFAFAAAMNGEIEQAEQKLRQAPAGNMSNSERIVHLATKGLVAFRLGDFEQGRLLYREAIQLARSLQDEAREIMARIYLAMEEGRCKSENAVQMCQEALDLASTRLVLPMATALGSQIRRRLDSLKHS